MAVLCEELRVVRRQPVRVGRETSQSVGGQQARVFRLVSDQLHQFEVRAELVPDARELGRIETLHENRILLPRVTEPFELGQ